MAKLSHFNNSKASTASHEVVYQNLFEVILTPPASISYNKQLFLDSIKKVGGLEVDKVPATVEQIYQFSKRRYAGAMPDTTTLDVTLTFTVNLDETNSMYTYNVLKKWCDLVYNPLTGAMGLKTEYTGSMLINVFNKKGDVFLTYDMPVVFPMSNLTALDLDYEQGGTTIYEISELTFAVDVWNVVRNDSLSV